MEKRAATAKHPGVTELQKKLCCSQPPLRHRFIPHLDRSGQAWRMAHLYTVFFTYQSTNQVLHILFPICGLCGTYVLKKVHIQCVLYFDLYIHILMYIYVIHEKHTLEVDSFLLKVG